MKLKAESDEGVVVVDLGEYDLFTYSSRYLPALMALIHHDTANIQ
jgi:hypothetical protein